MKISKLFHWLYAFLMFLPIVLFIPNAFYYGFNEHATAQEKTEQEPVYYETNEVATIDDLVIGKIYRWNDNYVPTYVPTGYEAIINIEKTPNLSLYVNQSLNFDDLSNFSLIIITNTGRLVCQYYDNNNTNRTFDLTNQPLDFVIKSYGTYFNNTSYLVSHISSSDALFIKEYIPIIYSMSISDSMYQAWQSTWNLPLLQWTHTSFVAQPFTFITGLFGVPSDSTLNYVFAYFVSISICWLVFDVIMYLPNLAHRWLDRGALE